jgi:ribosome-associated toxin RatA of RatAB toxin-antitoxin module
LPKFNFEKIIKAERNKVFEIASNYKDFEKKLPEFFPSIRVRSVRGDTAVVEEHVSLSGREIIMMTKHVTKYPDIHEVFVIGGDAKGSHVIERYQSIPEGTKISVEADIKLQGKLKIVGFFAKNKIKNDFIKIMDAFAKIAERE